VKNLEEISLSNEQEFMSKYSPW